MPRLERLPRLPGRFLLRMLALLALTAAIGLVYQAVEDYIPYWDYARIETLYNQLARAADDGPLAALGWLVDQVNRTEYNSVWALPMMVARDTFGASRDRIVMAVLMVHATLYLIAFGFLLRKVFGYESMNEVGVLQLGSVLLLPSLFTATMLGFETIAVLPVLTVAVLVFLVATWPERERSSGWRVGMYLLAGALLASTFLIRRAYAYTVISFYTTAGLVLIGEIILGRIAWRSRETVIRIGGLMAAGMGSAALLLAVARDRVLAVLATPYHELYAAWKISSMEVVRQLLASVGGVVLLAAAAGYLMRWRLLPPARRVMAVLLGGTAAMGFLQWMFFVRLRMRLDKPMLYAPMLALGTALLFTGRDQRRWSTILRGGCLALLLVNLAVSLGALPEVKAVRKVVFAQPLPPLTRPDMDQWRDLTTWLRDETVDDRGRGEPILVLAASGNINDSLVKEAEVRFFGWGKTRLNVPHFNSVDRTSNYPVWLHNAEWVLWAKPFQFHTSLRERRLLRFGWDEFDQQRGVSRNFELLEREWVIGRDERHPVTVQAFRRVRPDSTGEVLDLIERSRSFVVHHPVFPNPWIGLRTSRGFKATRVKRPGEHYTLWFAIGPADRATTSALLVETLSGPARARGKVVVRMGDPSDAVVTAEWLQAAAMREDRELVVARHTFPLVADRATKINAPAPAGDEALLRLGLERTSGSRTSGPPLWVLVNLEIAPHSR